MFQKSSIHKENQITSLPGKKGKIIGTYNTLNISIHILQTLRFKQQQIKRKA